MTDEQFKELLARLDKIIELWEASLKPKEVTFSYPFHQDRGLPGHMIIARGTPLDQNTDMGTIHPPDPKQDAS